MSFWKKKPVVVSLTDLLSNETYVEDYKQAEQNVAQSVGTSPLLQAVESSCGEVTKLMVECLSNNSQADPKCILLHHAFLICAGSKQSTCHPKKKTSFV